ncbi:MAG: alpha/beta fold hydrolase [Opitutales bacterium]
MHILALHGFTGVGSDFAPFAKLCDVAQWHGPNLPGHGPNPQLNCAPEAVLDWIQSQASALPSKSPGAAPEPTILLGYSMGARAALLHAIRCPEQWDALILISPNPGIEDEQDRARRRAVDEKLARRIEQDGVPAFIEFWQNTPMIRTQKTIREDWREAMQAQRKQHTAAGLAASLRQFGQGQCPNLWPELKRLTRPTLLLCGREDHKYTALAERMVNQLPCAVSRTIHQAGHMPQLENPAASAREINDFLQARAPSFNIR